MTRNMNTTCISVDLPGEEPLRLEELVLDYTGTLSRDGLLLPGVSERLVQLSEQVRITVLTADTFGTAAQQLAGLPASVRVVAGAEEKAQWLKQLGPERTIAMGNGRNDVPMVYLAALGIAVCGPEGMYAPLVLAADVVAADILSALDLLLNPIRLKATLRR